MPELREASTQRLHDELKRRNAPHMAAEHVQVGVPMMFDMVARFNLEVIDLPIPMTPTRLSNERKDHAVDHLKEELDEFDTAGIIDDELDALLDLVYVALGRILEMGILPGAAFEEVHLANMQKRQGTVPKRPNSQGLDAVKPEGWSPPDLTPYVSITRDQVRAAMLLDPAAIALLPFLTNPADKLPECLQTEMKSCFILPREDHVLEEDIIPSVAFGEEDAVARGLDDVIAINKGFKKDDSGKECRPELIPAPALYELGRLYAQGAKKYNAENWRKGADLQRYIGALERHHLKYRMGQRFDDDPQFGDKPPHHMIQVAWNAITIYMLEQLGTGNNDLPDFKED